jgi:CMP-N,N'-diacetyllegionaminic acid synthase
MKDTGILDIDSEEDFKLLEVLAFYFFNNERGYKEIFTNLNCLILSREFSW